MEKGNQAASGHFGNRELMLGPWSSPASMEHICEWAAHQHPLQGFLKTQQPGPHSEEGLVQWVSFHQWGTQGDLFIIPPTGIVGFEVVAWNNQCCFHIRFPSLNYMALMTHPTKRKVYVFIPHLQMVVLLVAEMVGAKESYLSDHITMLKCCRNRKSLSCLTLLWEKSTFIYGLHILELQRHTL